METINQPTVEEKTNKAVKLMKMLDIYKPYIDGFKEENNVCFFENYGGFWVYQEPEVEKKMKEIEEQYKCKVYAITHEYTEFGECYSFLLITNYPEEWNNLIYDNGHHEFYAFAYVWNKDDDDCSELGSVVVHSFGGGIKRIA